MEDTFATRSHPLTCPFCEVDELRPFGHNSARCGSCGGLLSGTLLETLHKKVKLPDVVGGHACECGHPEMRQLPDGVYRCPACGEDLRAAGRAPVHAVRELAHLRVPGLRLGGPPRLATLRVYDQVVAALSLPCIVEAVRHVRLEVQSVTLLQQILFA